METRDSLCQQNMVPISESPESLFRRSVLCIIPRRIKQNDTKHVRAANNHTVAWKSIMGVVVSTTKTSPFFLTTGIIGIVSFVFTLGTFFKVVWVNLDTLSEAPHEVSMLGDIVCGPCTDIAQVHSYLTNLRTELLEEKASLKNMRKGMRKYQRTALKENGATTVGMELDDVTLKTINDTLRHMITQFKALEQPFLEPGERGIGDASNHRKRSRRRNSSISPPHYDHAAYSSPPEKRARSNHERDEEQGAKYEGDEDAYWAERTRYANFTLERR